MGSRRYFSISEVITMLTEVGVSIGVSELANFTQEKLIHPVIYFDSLSAHACEGEKQDEGYKLFACGYCYVTGYFDLSDKIIDIMNNFAKGKVIKFETSIFLENFIGEPQISNWQVKHETFKRVPDDRLRLKSSIEQADIIAFNMLEEIDAKNIKITCQDFEYFKNDLLSRQIATQTEKAAEIKKLKRRKAAASQNGKKSGLSRRAVAADEWKKVRPNLLDFAKKNPGKTANYIAGVACKRDWVDKTQSAIGKLIRADPCFNNYIKK